MNVLPFLYIRMYAITFFQLAFAAELLEKLGDWEKLVKVYVNAQQWEQVGLACPYVWYVYIL